MAMLITCILFTLVPHITSAAEMETMKRWIMENVSGAELEERTYHGQVRFGVPNTASEKGQQGQTISELFNLLEMHKEKIGGGVLLRQPLDAGSGIFECC